ncbi:MAG TPA: sugar transferase [Longimicrobium sp.]
MSAGRGYAAAKRAFDLAAAAAGVVALSPLLLSVALAVKLDSRGPLFYRGERIGLGGRRFRIFKFRTMRPDAERMGTTTALGDPRITRVGRFLRRYKLDELPQLLNVLSGEMSVVGPRPEVEEHTREYAGDELEILTVKPGITDYSSIRFVALDEVLGSEDPHTLFVTRYRAEKNRLRVEYVRNRSFAEDLRIIFLTLAAVAGKARRKKPAAAEG